MKHHAALSTLLCALLALACNQADPRLRPGQDPKPEIAATTHFDLLPPERTGIDFVPTVVDEFRYNFIADPYIYNGGGVAVLDVNNDGLQDLFFTARLQPCRLYLNKGGFRFEDISESSGVSKFIGLKTGVTVVDINADGWQDLYICRTWLEPIPERRNLLFVNAGTLSTGQGWAGTFTEQAAAYGLDDLSASQHANFFDYDLDGDLDCYILNHPTDFKNINTLDYAAGNARQQPPRNAHESDRLLRNDGDKFTDVTAQAGLTNRAFGLSTLASDFNGDGRPDLFVGNDFVMPDFLYLNMGGGKFTDAADRNFRHTSNHTMGADFADLNRDGYPDLVTMDMLAENWSRRQRLMNTMQRPRDRQMQQLGYGRQVMRNAVQLGLLRPLQRRGDTILPSPIWRGARDEVRVSPPSEGLGEAGGFSEIGCLSGIYATDWSWAPLIADFDNDGWRDLFITSGVQRDLNDLDFFLYTADSINRTGGISKARFPNFQDYVNLMPSAPSHNYLYQNTGSLHFTDVSKAWGFEKPSFSNGAAYADLDNDGDLDLITNNLGSPPGIYENKAIGTNPNHWLQIKCQGTALNPIGQGAKVRVWAGGQQIFAQEMTPVRGFYSSVEPIFQVGLGQHMTVERIEVDWQENKCQVLTQVPTDQRIILDIAQAKPGRCPREQPATPQFFWEKPTALPLAFTHRENDFEDFDREKLLPYRLSRSGPALVVGDLNGDGADDLIATGAVGQASAIFLQKTDGTLSPTPQPALETDRDHEDTAAALLDADGDGDLDVYIVSGGNEQPAGAAFYQDRMYLNDGTGHLVRTENTLPTETASGSCVRAHDVDGDGRAEIFVGGRSVPGRFPEVAQSFVLAPRNPVLGGTQPEQSTRIQFVDATASLCPDFAQIGMVTDIQFGDLTGDGKAEMVVACDWGNVSVFQWDGQKFQNRTSEFGLQNTAGWWNSLALADLDGDGDLDIAAGNEGLNHRLRASQAAPLRLFANDFDGNGSLDPLLCIADNGAYRPVMQRDALAAQVPSVKRKFTRYAPYADAAVTDIFPEKNLLGGLCLATQVFETQWFENQGGRFVPRKLPLEAQVSPVQHIIATDCTGDGLTDLLMVGNDYDSDIETYQQDASNGCLLRGDGRGGFTAVSNQVSGLWANREARDAVILKIKNGQRLLIVGNCDGPAQVFSVQK